MTLLSFNGFEGYDTPYDQRDASDFINLIQVPNFIYSTGRNGGASLKYNDYQFGQGVVRFNFSSIDNTKTAIMGMAIKFGNLGSGNNVVIEFSESINSWIGFQADLLSNGSLRLRLKYYSTTLVSYDYPLTANQWYYIEVKYKCHDTLGVGVVRVNEQEVINFSGDTKSGLVGNTTIQWFELSFPYSVDMEVDDIYIADTEGTENNDFLGDIRIDAIHPNGAGNHTDLAPSVGANYECIDETTMDDTDYVEGVNVADKDSYSYADVPTDLNDAGIIGLQIKNNCKRTASATNIKIDPFIRTGSTDYSQTVQDLPDTIGIVFGDIIIEDPSDSNPWTQAKINACEFGMEVA